MEKRRGPMNNLQEIISLAYPLGKASKFNSAELKEEV